jgi:hypothetical protein
MSTILREFFTALATLWTEIIKPDFWGEAEAVGKATRQYISGPQKETARHSCYSGTMHLNC